MYVRVCVYVCVCDVTLSFCFSVISLFSARSLATFLAAFSFDRALQILQQHVCMYVYGCMYVCIYVCMYVRTSFSFACELPPLS